MNDKTKNESEGKVQKPQTPKEAVAKNKDLVLMGKEGVELPVHKNQVGQHERLGWKKI